MKNLINCDYERTMNKIQDAENAHNKKKMPYDRLLTVKATGKYSSKQSDTNMKISTARYNRRRMNNIALKQALEEEAKLIEEDVMIEQGILQESDLQLI